MEARKHQNISTGTHRDEEAEGLHHVADRRAPEHPLQPDPRHLELFDEQHRRPQVVALRLLHRALSRGLGRLK